MSVPIELAAPDETGGTAYAILTDLATGDRWDNVNNQWTASPSGTDHHIALTEGTGANVGHWTATVSHANLGTKLKVRKTVYMNSTFIGAALTTIVNGTEAWYGYQPAYYALITVSRYLSIDRYRAALYRDGQPTSSGASSVTITLEDTVGNTTVVNAASMTQHGSTNVWEYDVDPSTTAASLPYRALVNWTIDGAARSFSMVVNQR